jgi:hypothetical protein
VIDNPFAILSAVAAPAILTNACSVLALGTSNRVARVVDQTKQVIGEIKAADAAGVEQHGRVARLERLRDRAMLLIGALRLIYGALGGFASAALFSVVGASALATRQTLVADGAAIVGLVAGVSSVAALASGCARMVAETRLALKSVDEQVTEALSRKVI